MPAVAAFKKVPQTKSITVIMIGQSFKVARLVKSYVPYAIKPKNPPTKMAYCRLSFKRAG